MDGSVTPTQILTAARRKYNSVSDGFFSDAELLGLLWDRCRDLAIRTLCIERAFTTSTVASQRDYDRPTNAIAVKRIQYDGQRLHKITEREDDTLTLYDEDTTSTGTPTYYQEWDETISLRPIPSAVATLKIWAFCEPQELTISSTLEIPTIAHGTIINGMVADMVGKDENWAAFDRYELKFEKGVMELKKYLAKRKRTDGPAFVQDEEMLASTVLGRV